MATRIESVCQTLSEIAPLRLAESWDNVGLLIGDRARDCSRVMTCLTISPPVVDEAIENDVDLIVTHHPLPFKAMARLTTDTVATRMVLQLIEARVGVFSAHTAFDSAASGINRQLAEGLQLSDIQPLDPQEQGEGLLGSGRCGRTPDPFNFEDLVRKSASFLKLSSIRYVGDLDAPVTKVALACGSGGTFLNLARKKGCDAMLTGESNFHGCLEAQSTGVGLILVGHYASERFAMDRLAVQLAGEHEDLKVWASQAESDPICQLNC